eukprot:1290486-Amphidinium_carterae.1
MPADISTNKTEGSCLHSTLGAYTGNLHAYRPHAPCSIISCTFRGRHHFISNSLRCPQMMNMRQAPEAMFQRAAREAAQLNHKDIAASSDLGPMPCTK